MSGRIAEAIYQAAMSSLVHWRTVQIVDSLEDDPTCGIRLSDLPHPPRIAPLKLRYADGTDRFATRKMLAAATNPLGRSRD